MNKLWYIPRACWAELPATPEDGNFFLPRWAWMGKAHSGLWKAQVISLSLYIYIYVYICILFSFLFFYLEFGWLEPLQKWWISSMIYIHTLSWAVSTLASAFFNCHVVAAPWNEELESEWCIGVERCCCGVRVSLFARPRTANVDLYMWTWRSKSGPTWTRYANKNVKLEKSISFINNVENKIRLHYF